MADADDAFPLDPDETVDTDGDGVGNNADGDDDGDGVADADDPHPLDPDRTPELVSVPDPALRAKLGGYLNKGPGDAIYAHQLARLVLFSAEDAGVVSLEGLQFATNLEELRLKGNRIVDLAPLSELARLGRLDLRENRVEDLHPLSGLTALASLTISDNLVKNLTPLSSLENLTGLWAHGNDIDDLRPLSGLVGLTKLHLHSNAVADLTPLESMDQLQELGLSRNRIVDFTPLGGLTELRELHLSNSNIADLSFMSGLRALEVVQLTRNPIVDLSPLSGLPALEQLWIAYLTGDAVAALSSLSDVPALEFMHLAGNGLADLSPLARFPQLTGLNLYSNRIVDVAPLLQLPLLTDLYLSRNLIEDLAPLSKLTRLELLHLSRNPSVADLTPLSSLTSLEYLNLDYNKQVLDLEVLSELSALKLLSLHANGAAYDLKPLSGLDGLTDLWLGYNDVTDLKPLAGLKALTYIDLRGNGLSDLTPLEGLPALERLDLDNNRISDLSPLAGNPGLGAGDFVDVRLNPLGVTSVDLHVPALQDRGVEVVFDQFAVHAADGPRIHNDNLFVLPVPGNVATDEHLPFKEFAARFYAHFDDAFDFLFFISNVEFGRIRIRPYAGRYITVANGVRGTGVDEHMRASEYGSAGRLQGMIEFPLLNVSIEGGPALHELMHRWANYVVAPFPHWGFTSAYGQLGGFQADRLVDLGGGRHTAGEFGTYANGGNSVPYSSIELYLAGFIPPGEVPDLLVAEDAEWSRDGDGQREFSDDGFPVFTATRISRRSVQDLIAEHGARMPDHTQAQREFRAAAILLIDESHPAFQSQLDQLSAEVAWFSDARADTNHGTFNFYEATGGRAIMAMGGLSEFNTGTHVPSTPGRASSTTLWTPLDESARGRVRSDHFDSQAPDLFRPPPPALDGFARPLQLHGAWCNHEVQP